MTKCEAIMRKCGELGLLLTVRGADVEPCGERATYIFGDGHDVLFTAHGYHSARSFLFGFEAGKKE